MSLSRKHYEAVAEIIEAHTPVVVRDDWDKGLLAGLSNVAEALSIYFAEDNPNFDPAKFLAACNVEAT